MKWGGWTGNACPWRVLGWLSHDAENSAPNPKGIAKEERGLGPRPQPTFRPGFPQHRAGQPGHQLPYPVLEMAYTDAFPTGCPGSCTCSGIWCTLGAQEMPVKRHTVRSVGSGILMHPPTWVRPEAHQNPRHGPPHSCPDPKPTPSGSLPRLPHPLPASALPLPALRFCSPPTKPISKGLSLEPKYQEARCHLPCVSKHRISEQNATQDTNSMAGRSGCLSSPGSSSPRLPREGRSHHPSFASLGVSRHMVHTGSRHPGVSVHDMDVPVPDLLPTSLGSLNPNWAQQPRGCQPPLPSPLKAWLKYPHAVKSEQK